VGMVTSAGVVRKDVHLLRSSVMTATSDMKALRPGNERVQLSAIPLTKP
jgi:hypothetical protein